MRLTVDQGDLLRLTAAAADVADKKSPMPITRCVRLVTQAATGRQVLEGTATDLYTSSRYVVPCDVKEPGAVCVDARAIKDLAARLPSGDVSLSTDDKRALVVKCGKSRYRLHTMHADDYPEPPRMPPDCHEVDGAAIAASLDAVKSAMCTEDSRTHLSCVFMDGEDGVCVTTDGHRLHKVEGATLAPGVVQVPIKGVALLGKLAGSGVLEVATHGGNLFVRQDGHTVSVKLVDETFPQWRKVVPPRSGKPVVVARDLLSATLKRLSYVTEGAIKMQARDGVLLLKADSPNVGEGAEEVSCDYAGTTDVVGMNARYLMDAIGAVMCDDVRVWMGDQLDPVIVTGEAFEAVIMPMRV